MSNPLIRYSGILKMDARTQTKGLKEKKMITIHWALHPRDKIDRLYVSRKEGGRRFAYSEDCVEAPVKALDDNIKKSKERVITADRNNIVNVRTDRKTTKNKKHKWEENNCMNISRDKLARLQTRRSGYGYEMEISSQRRNLFKE